MHLLVGDIGGTKTELALFDGTRKGSQPVQRARYPSTEFESLEAVTNRFIEEFDVPQFRAAAFGVAGPVVNQQCRTTNLPWFLDGESLAQHLRCPVRLLNDFEAIALGIGELGPSQLHVLQAGNRVADGPQAIIGAGTGLGEAIVLPRPEGPLVLASEGGHCDFAPRTDGEMALLRFMQRRHGRVSVERVVSGMGLAELFDFVVESGHALPQPHIVTALAESSQPAAIIGQAGLEGSCAASSKALELFVTLYGAEAGNLALKVLPYGGLFIAGGIAPKLLTALTDGRFMSALLDKGRMRPLLESMFVAVVLEPQVALQGAMRKAAGLIKD